MGLKEIKKPFFIFLLLTILISSHIMLKLKYNDKVSEIRISRVLNEDIKIRLKRAVSDYAYTANYIKYGPYGKTIYTEGRDNEIEELNISQGAFLSPGGQKAVIGDEVADAYFRSYNVLGREINFGGKDYNVVGVIADSSDVYLPYDEDVKVDFDKMIIKYKTEKPSDYITRGEGIKNNLAKFGVVCPFEDRYIDKLNLFNNLIAFVLIYLITKMLLNDSMKVFRELRDHYKEYRRQIRRFTVFDYIKQNYKSTFKTFSLMVYWIVFVGIEVLLLKQIKIPTKFIPGNLFSPTSYKDVFENVMFEFNRKAVLGFSEISSDIITYMLNGALIMVFALIVFKTVEFGRNKKVS